jgi:Domain of unknown function (DUF397)
MTGTYGDTSARHDTDSPEVFNGMPSTSVPLAGPWMKSRLSNPSGNCVELGELPAGAGVAVRNSRDPEGPALIYTLAEIDAFVRGAAAGDFDRFLR